MRYEQYLNVIDGKSDVFCNISDFLWENPEIPFHEYEAAKLITGALEKEAAGIWTGAADSACWYSDDASDRKNREKDRSGWCGKR